MTQPRHRRRVTGPGAPRAGRRVAMAMLAPLLVLLGVLGSLSAAAPPAAAAGSCTGPLANGQIRVVIVVDPGESGPRGPMATCLVVVAGTAGSKILAQRASELGLPSPRYAGSGLLCGLDGFPSTACPVNTGGSYAYWAYFNGADGNWSYAHDNPFVRRMVDGEIMGWRYTDGSPDGAAPMPRLSPTDSLFPPLTPTTTAPAPAPAPAPPAAAPAAGGLGAATTDPLAAATDPGASAPGPSADATASPDSSVAAMSDDPPDGGEELASAPASSSGSGAGRWVGVAVAVAAVGALGVGAVTRTRARARS